jgi:hypothetical protein
MQLNLTLSTFIIRLPVYSRFSLLNNIIRKIPTPTPAHPKQDVQVFPGHLDKESNPVKPPDAPNTVESSLCFSFSITYGLLGAYFFASPARYAGELIYFGTSLCHFQRPGGAHISTGIATVAL